MRERERESMGVTEGKTEAFTNQMLELELMRFSQSPRSGRI